MTFFGRGKVTVAAGLSALALSGAALAQPWGYQGETGPQNWAKLDPKYAMCGIGQNQSPVDLDNTIGANLKPLRLRYQAGAKDIVNTGETVQVNYAPGSLLVVEGQHFQLAQFHFHAPSENRVAGRAYPMEAHLVHLNGFGQLAVLAVMFNVGAPNGFLARIWERIPAKEAKADLPPGLNVMQMLPTLKGYYRFNGSLTTPPCSEGVRWMVLKSPVTASKEQIDRFTKAIGFPNNRPLQPVNARPLLK
jgi:carbonic anhydrase